MHSILVFLFPSFSLNIMNLDYLFGPSTPLLQNWGSQKYILCVKCLKTIIGHSRTFEYKKHEVKVNPVRGCIISWDKLDPVIILLYTENNIITQILTKEMTK